MLRLQSKIDTKNLTICFRLIAMVSLIILGSIFAHHDASAHSLTHEHGLSGADETLHAHVSQDSDKDSFDISPLHCGSNILGAAALPSGVLVSSKQKHESQKLAGMESRLSSSDPPPPRLSS